MKVQCRQSFCKLRLLRTSSFSTYMSLRSECRVEFWLFNNKIPLRLQRRTETTILYMTWNVYYPYRKKITSTQNSRYPPAQNKLPIARHAAGEIVEYSTTHTLPEPCVEENHNNNKQVMFPTIRIIMLKPQSTESYKAPHMKSTTTTKSDTNHQGFVVALEFVLLLHQ